MSHLWQETVNCYWFSVVADFKRWYDFKLNKITMCLSEIFENKKTVDVLPVGPPSPVRMKYCVKFGDIEW